MRKKQLIVVGIGVAAVLSGVLLLAPRGAKPLSSLGPPITLHYLPPRAPEAAASFWVSNHTDKALAVFISEVQVRSGSVWTNYAKFPGERLVFSEEVGKPPTLLGPHEADVGTWDGGILSLPAASPWRVKALALESLTGVTSAAELARREKWLLELRYRQGFTNVTLNPFSSKIARYGRPREVVSEEVLPVAVADAPVPGARVVKSTVPLPTASPEAIARAREALRQKMGDLFVEPATSPPAAGASK